MDGKRRGKTIVQTIRSECVTSAKRHFRKRIYLKKKTVDFYSNTRVVKCTVHYTVICGWYYSVGLWENEAEVGWFNRLEPSELTWPKNRPKIQFNFFIF